jgi:predicted phage gp36 major capsid-like protein
LAVASTISSPGFVTTASTSSSPSRSLTAMMPLQSATAVSASSAVFFTTPLAGGDASGSWLGTLEARRTARQSATFSPCSKLEQVDHAPAPRRRGASSGSSNTRSE